MESDPQSLTQIQRSTKTKSVRRCARALQSSGSTEKDDRSADLQFGPPLPVFDPSTIDMGQDQSPNPSHFADYYDILPEVHASLWERDTEWTTHHGYYGESTVEKLGWGTSDVGQPSRKRKQTVETQIEWPAPGVERVAKRGKRLSRPIPPLKLRTSARHPTVHLPSTSSTLLNHPNPSPWPQVVSPIHFALDHDSIPLDPAHRNGGVGLQAVTTAMHNVQLQLEIDHAIVSAEPSGAPPSHPHFNIYSTQSSTLAAISLGGLVGDIDMPVIAAREPTRLPDPPMIRSSSRRGGVSAASKEWVQKCGGELTKADSHPLWSDTIERWIKFEGINQFQVCTSLKTTLSLSLSCTITCTRKDRSPSLVVSARSQIGWGQGVLTALRPYRDNLLRSGEHGGCLCSQRGGEAINYIGKMPPPWLDQRVLGPC